MSQWFVPKLTELEIVDDELQIFIKQDYFGSNYFAVKLEDIRKLLVEHDINKGKSNGD
jgi:hypothetical protein